MKGNMGQMLKQAQRMQAEMARVQEELKEESVEASVGGGAIKVVMGGDLTVKRVILDAAAVDPDETGMLEDMIAAAVNEALRQAQELAGSKMQRVTGGMSVPGLF